MGANSKIEWTATAHADGSVTPGASWNPIRARRLGARTDPNYGKVGWHCQHVSEGCKFCYAETFNRRLGTGLEYKPGHLASGAIELFLDEKMLLAPLRWNKPRKIFVASMTDLFADFVPDAFIDRMFAVMALCPQHTFQCVTKRPKRMRGWFARERDRTALTECLAELYVGHPQIAERWPFDKRRAIETGTRGWPLPNVWSGTSVEDQPAADTRIPDLLATPAAVRFLSVEPLLGLVNLTRYLAPEFSRCQNDGSPAVHQIARAAARKFGGRGFIDWVIVGGESGPNARPMNPQWARSLMLQCRDSGVPFFMKQMGGVRDKRADFDGLPSDLQVREFPHAS